MNERLSTKTIEEIEVIFRREQPLRVVLSDGCGPMYESGRGDLSGRLGAALAAQFDAYEALPGLHLKGKQELGENIADVAGLAAAYEAYHASLNGKEPPVIGGLTGDQRFFLSFAQSWRTKMREQLLRARIATDVHAPARWRVQTVRNIDAWYPAFNVQPGQLLYLPADKRVKVW